MAKILASLYTIILSPPALPAAAEQHVGESVTKVRIVIYVDFPINNPEVQTSHPNDQRLYLYDLPTEIIIQIFALVLVNSHEFVVILAQLSRHLREIVLSTPGLWSVVSLTNKKYTLERARLWRSRNNGLLKALYIRASPGFHILSAFEVFSDVPLDALRYLMIDEWTYDALHKYMPNLTPSVIANLHTLHIRHSDQSWLTATFSSLSLRHLIAEASIIDWARLGEYATQLRRLVYVEGIDSRSVPDILWALHRNTNLESVYMQSDGHMSGNGLPQPSVVPKVLPSRIQLPHLESLTVHGGALGDGQLWEHLSLPNLRTVDLARLWANINPMIINLQNSGAVPNLMSLSISYTFGSGSFPSQALVIQVLREAKQLRYLQLFQLPCIQDIIHAMTHEPTEHCPNLTTLDLSMCREVSAELLAPLVEARNERAFNIEGQVSDSSDDAHRAGHAQVSPIRKLVLNGCKLLAVDQVILPWLKQRVSRVTCHYDRTRRERQPRRR
ncbi:hypothetical protein BDW22DRAFT_1479728 [Trametopsis cervina]|nr:hypothetical protein BDW22DRAFT_1479728 [Trametopsis cervina]